jgi:Putative DNA-binding domain
LQGDDVVVSFTLDRPVDFEESLTCEFKEAKAQPVQAVSNIVDQYVVAFLNEAGGSIYWGIRDADRVVTGVPISDKIRDELKQVIGQKVASIAPPVPAAMVEAPFTTSWAQEATRSRACASLRFESQSHRLLGCS